MQVLNQPRLKKSTKPYSYKGETVYVYHDCENGVVNVSDTPDFERVYPVPYDELEPGKKEVKPISKFSDQRLEDNKIYLTLRNVFLENHPNCEANLPGCKRVASEVHHKKGRRGMTLNEVEFWLPLCRNCHDWIHLNIDKSLQMGLIMSKLHI